MPVPPPVSPSNPPPILLGDVPPEPPVEVPPPDEPPDPLPDEPLPDDPPPDDVPEPVLAVARVLAKGVTDSPPDTDAIKLISSWNPNVNDQATPASEGPDMPCSAWNVIMTKPLRDAVTLLDHCDWLLWVSGIVGVVPVPVPVPGPPLVVVPLVPVVPLPPFAPLPPFGLLPPLAPLAELSLTALLTLNAITSVSVKLQCVESICVKSTT